MGRNIGVLAVLALLWLGLAAGLDTFVVRPRCTSCVDLASLKLTLTTPAAVLEFPSISLLVLFGVPLVVSAFALVPWRTPKTASAWQQSFTRWSQPLVWLAVAVGLAILLESIFLLVKDTLWAGITNVAEKFTVTALVSVGGFKLSLTGGGSSFVGLVVGSYLFLSKGLRGLLSWPKASNPRLQRTAAP